MATVTQNARVPPQFDEAESESFEFLEPESDQQYVREQRTEVANNNAVQQQSPQKAKRSSALPPTVPLLPDDAQLAVRQRAPVIIVERQVQTNTLTNDGVSVSDRGSAGHASPMSQTVTTRTIATTAPDQATDLDGNVGQQTGTHTPGSPNSAWSDAVSHVVSLTLRFLLMAVIAFVTLVALNPPFLRATTDGSALAHESADLTRAAWWSAAAGGLFIALPYLWSVASSRFFPSDMLMATGITKPRRRSASRRTTKR